MRWNMEDNMQELDYSLAVGTMIGDYRIIDILGVGGFGKTCKAQDTRLNRTVEIKEFLPVQLSARGETYLRACTLLSRIKKMALKIAEMASASFRNYNYAQ